MNRPAITETIIRATENAEQKADRDAMTDTANHRAAGKAALEILSRELAFETGKRLDRLTGQEIASIIYAAIRNEREL